MIAVRVNSSYEIPDSDDCKGSVGCIKILELQGEPTFGIDISEAVKVELQESDELMHKPWYLDDLLCQRARRNLKQQLQSC